ncbi:phage head completion protein [Mangrovicoccus ximenensis]|uniref:phage head completion protein n=1 Tax=Mangrovicoccus ximenensis TaxID=1911570 RepID=UPI000D378535|nr:head-tail adaptor protein [Mangrovicoccus ximenensis]
MSAGQRQFRAVFEKPVKVSDGYGGYDVTWEALGPRWVGMATAAPAVADEEFSQSREVQVLDHVLSVIDDPETRTITAEWRVTVQGRVMNLRAVGFPVFGKIRVNAQEGTAP